MKKILFVVLTLGLLTVAVPSFAAVNTAGQTAAGAHKILAGKIINKTAKNSQANSAAIKACRQTYAAGLKTNKAAYTAAVKSANDAYKAAAAQAKTDHAAALKAATDAAGKTAANKAYNTALTAAKKAKKDAITAAAQTMKTVNNPVKAALKTCLQTIAVTATSTAATK